MKEKIELSDFPFEIQKRVLDRLGDKDHVSMYRVSKSWQVMISQYLRIAFQFLFHLICVGTLINSYYSYIMAFSPGLLIYWLYNTEP